MPPKKKKSEDPVKEYGEKEIRENVIPLDEHDVSHAIDVPVKPKVEIETIEKVGEVKKHTKKKVVRKRTSKRKTAKKKKSGNWVDQFKIPGNKKLKKDGPILIITEKPQSSVKISDALAEGKVTKYSKNGVNYYEFFRGGKEIQVACAVGHLFTLAQVHQRNKWPTFEIKWAPNYLVRNKDFTKKYYDVISKLSKTASEIIIATDYDIEGEVIGLNIVRFICNQPDAKRMKFSTLTSKEIQDSYEHRSNTLDWKQGIAGETRHYLDWIYGINLSRALMDAVKTTGTFRLMSIGRVQGPALYMIVKKEREIQKFIPSKYWQIFADVDDGKNIVEVKYLKDITKESELPKFKELEGKTGNAETKKSQQHINPPVPFDLTSLQTEAYKFYKITPSKTLEIAQRLYLGGVISYPRTSSQKIPKEIGYDKILERLKSRFSFTKHITKKTPIEGRKADPAHPSIYPTGEFHESRDDDKKIYELIVKRFVGCFCDYAILDDKKITIMIEKNKFTAKGMAINKKGWMEVYPMLLKEKEIPDLDGEVDVNKINIEEKMTQPPRRYSPASIISDLEKKNLGTKATRASILETLYNRKYINGKSIQATSLGMSLIDTLEDNCPIIIDEKLTRDIEKNLVKLRNSKNLEKKEKEILDDTKKVIHKIGDQFTENKEKIGKDLVDATSALWEEEKKENELMGCKICNKGKLGIKYNKASRRYFVACDAYPECKTTYSLPPNALIKRVEDKTCPECEWPMLMSIKKGKRPWIFCFNPDCVTRKKEDSTN